MCIIIWTTWAEDEEQRAGACLSCMASPDTAKLPYLMIFRLTGAYVYRWIPARLRRDCFTFAQIFTIGCKSCWRMLILFKDFWNDGTKWENKKGAFSVWVLTWFPVTSTVPDTSRRFYVFHFILLSLTLMTTAETSILSLNKQVCSSMKRKTIWQLETSYQCSIFQECLF